MHLKSLQILQHKFPTTEHYPFKLGVMQKTKRIDFKTPVTFLIGQNGSGKSTLLRAIARKSSIHIWEDNELSGFVINRFAEQLYTCLSFDWADSVVKGAFFGSDIFKNFARILDEWAKTDPDLLNYFGGESLMVKSHGECNMRFFETRFSIKGLYLLDEPESALSPKSQLELIRIIQTMSQMGHAQFIIASHSPILLAMPGATIYSFDESPVKMIDYEETDYYIVYKDFLNNRSNYFAESVNFG
jgi:predicted ATPase